jgi:hypothetical protein
MENPTDSPRSRRHREYEDPHFHDEIEAVPTEDAPRPPQPKIPAARKPLRRPPPPRRRFEDD